MHVEFTANRFRWAFRWANSDWGETRLAFGVALHDVLLNELAVARVRLWCVVWRWSWERVWGKRSLAQEYGGALRRAVSEAILRELALPNPFGRFLPKLPVISWEVVHGEVVRVVEEAPPEPETRGDRITIAGVEPLFMGPGPGSPERPMSDQELDVCMEAARETMWPETMRIGTISAEQIALGRIDAGGLLGVAEPPTSFCADCPGRFRPQDLFIGTKSATPLCEGCLDRRVARGAAKKPGEF